MSAIATACWWWTSPPAPPRTTWWTTCAARLRDAARRAHRHPRSLRHRRPARLRGQGHAPGPLPDRGREDLSRHRPPRLRHHDRRRHGRAALRPAGRSPWTAPRWRRPRAPSWASRCRSRPRTPPSAAAASVSTTWPAAAWPWSGCPSASWSTRSRCGARRARRSSWRCAARPGPTCARSPAIWARRLGTGAHLVALRRIRSGTFGEETAVGWDDVPVRGREALIPMAALLPDLPAVTVTDEGERALRFGRDLAAPLPRAAASRPRRGRGGASSTGRGRWWPWPARGGRRRKGSCPWTPSSTPTSCCSRRPAAARLASRRRRTCRSPARSKASGRPAITAERVSARGSGA